MLTDNEGFYTSSFEIIEKQEEIISTFFPIIPCQSPKEGKEKNGKKETLKTEKRRKKWLTVGQCLMTDGYFKSC